MTISQQNYTPIHHSLITGCTIGAVEALIHHPFWVLATRAQTGLPFTLQPQVIYRGLAVHCIGAFPVDVLQVTVSRVVFERVLSKELSENQRRLIGGFTGGVVSNLFNCPMDQVMTWQQKSKSGPKEAILDIYRTRQIQGFFNGFVALSFREGIYCTGIFAAVPLIAKECKFHQLPESQTTLISGLASGILTTIASHPWEVIRSKMQFSLEKISMRSVVKNILEENGYKGFFTGLKYRVIRVTSSVFFLGNLTRFFENFFEMEGR